MYLDIVATHFGQFNLEVFVNLGVGPVELKVQNWSSGLIIGAQGSKLELMVDNWSSRLRIGADGSNLEHTVHVLDLELMAQRVSIMTSFFWACYDKGFWVSRDKSFLCAL